MASRATAEGEEAVTACAYAFVANLCLHPRVIDLTVEYWLQNYVPLTVRNGVVERVVSGDQELVCHLIARLYAGADDVCLVGQGSLALSADAEAPRYVHYLNFVAPAGRDFSLAVPLRHYLRRETAPLLASLLALFLHAGDVWKRVQHGTTMGEHLLTFFHAGHHETEWQRLFSPLAFALEVACRVLLALRDTAPPEWFYARDASDGGGIAFAAALLAALGQRRCQSVHFDEEQRVLGALRRAAAAASPTLGVMQTTLAAFLEARAAMRAALATLYRQFADRLNYRFCLDDATEPFFWLPPRKHPPLRDR